MEVDHAGTYMTLEEFESLPEYGYSLPTGTTEGKRWRQRDPYMTLHGMIHTWWMGEYGRAQGDSVPIHWRQIFIVTEENE